MISRSFPIGRLVVGVLLLLILLFGAHELYWAIGTSDPGHVLMKAVEEGDTEEVRELLKQGVDPNFSANNETPLKLARKHGYSEIVVLLQQSGAKE